MNIDRALEALRADVAPTNIRAAAAVAPDEKTADDLEQLAWDLARHPQDTVTALKAAWILLPREDAFKTACAALACLFGAPTHPATVAPYTAVLREAGALGAVLYSVSRYSAFWSCACSPEGMLLNELEAALTAGVIDECRRTGQDA